MSDNRELKLTVVVDDSNLKDFRQQLLDWKKDFPKDAKATSGKITTAFEEIADAAKSSNAAIRSLVAENSSTLSKMSTALDSVTSAMVGVQAAFDRFEKLGGKMKAITDAVTTVQGATKQLEADLKAVPARVESELAKVSTAVKGRAKKLKDDLAAQKPAEIKVAAEFDAEKLLKPLQGIKSEISKLGTKIKNIKISPKLDAKPVTAGLKQIQEQLALLSAVQKPIALSLDFDPLLAGLNRIEGSIGQLATSLAEQSERFAQAGKKSGEAFGGQLKQETEEAAKQAATNAQKILNARFLAKGATAQLTETLQAQLAAAQGVNPEALTRRFSSFAIGDSLNFKAYMDSLDLQTKQLQAKVAQIMKAAVVAPYTYAGAEWWEKALAEKDAGVKAYFASLDPDTKQLQSRVKQVMKSAVVAPYEYAGSEWWEQILAEKDAGVRAYFDSLNPDTKKLESKVRQIMKAAVVAPYTYAGAEWWEKALSEKEAGVKAYFESLDPDTKQLQNKVKQVMKAAVVAPYTYAGAEWWEKVMAEQAAGAQKIVQQYNQIAATTQAARNRMLKVVSSADGGDAATFAMVNPGARIRDKFELQDMAEFYRSGQSGGEALGLTSAAEEVKKFSKTAAGSVASNTAFNKSLDDMKFAARGVASGFNAMWLTWGNLVPLLSGALISNAFVQATKQGADFAYQLDVISVLGQESASNVTKVKEAALELGAEGPFGPQQVAEAFKTLALAGVRAKDQIFAVKDVMNLALVGQLDLNEAAEALVGISTAFGFTVAGYTKVNDVIAKTAAESQASVQTITESMKQASTVAEQYAISVEDVGTAITSLAKRNITGSAAGTSIRNFYNEITGGSEKARKALEAIKFTAFEEGSGKIKDLVTLVKDFEKATAGFSNEKFLETMKTVFNERATKGFSALITDLRKTRQEGGETASVLEQTYQKIADSAGFAIISSAQLAQSTVNQMKGVKSALETSLVSVFDDLEPTILQLSGSLKELFNSPEFKEGIKSIVLGFADFAVKLYAVKDVLFEVAKAYVAFKVISGASTLFNLMGTAALGAAGALKFFAVQAKESGAAAALASAVTSSSAAKMGAATAATAAGSAAAAGTAVKGLGAAAARFVSFLGPIGAAVGTVASLMLLYGDRSVNAINSSADAAKTRGKDILDQLDQEIERLQQQLVLKRAVNNENAFVSLVPRKTEQQFAADLKVADQNIQNAKGRDAVERANNARTKLINEYAAQQKEFAGEASRRTKELRDVQASLLKEDQAAIQDALRKGPTNPVDPDLNPRDETSKQRDVYRQLSALEEKSANREKEILDAKLKYKLVAEESYVQQLEKLKQEEAETLLKYNLEQFEEAPTKFKGEELQKQYELLVKQRQAIVDNVASENKLAEIKFRGQENLDAIKLEKDLRTTSLQVTNELAKAQAEFNAVAVAPEVAAAQAARLKVEQDFSKILTERQTEQEKFQEELLLLQNQEGEFDQKAADSLNAKIAGKQLEIEKIKATTEALAQQAEQQARNNELLKKNPIRNVQKAVSEYYNELNNLGTVAGNVARQSLQKLEDAFTEFVQTGKFSASTLFDTLKAEMARFLAKQYIMRPITVLVNAVLGGVSLGGLFGGAGLANAAGGLDGGAGDAGAGSIMALGDTVAGVKSIANTASMLSKLPSLLSGGIAGLETTIYNAFARGGAQLGLTGTKNIAFANTGTALAGAGIAYGGYQLGRGISGGYSLNGGTGNGTVNAGATVGAILGALSGGPFGAAVGSALGSIVGGTVNRLFGRKRINGASGVEGTFNADGLKDARSFQDVTLKGGAFRKSKSFTEYFSIDTKAIDAVNQAFVDAKQSIELASNALRADFLPGLNNLNLTGRLGSDLQAVLSNASDALVKEIIKVSVGINDDFLSFLQGIKQESEKLVDTFIRVAQGVSIANSALLQLGQSAQFSIGSAETAMGLLSSLGDSGVSLLEQFVQNFVPAREQFVRQTALFEQAVNELGLATKVSATTTREEFRSLVESLDLTTAAGQRELGLLLQIMPQLDSLIQRREQEAVAIDELTLSISNLIVETGKQALTAIQDQIKLSKQAADQARESAAAYQALATSLRESGRAAFARSTRSESQALGQQFNTTFQAAATGDKDALGRLGAEATSYLDAFKKQATTGLQYTLEAARVGNQLNQAAAVAEVLGVGADFQAKLFDVQTAALEVVQEQLQAGNLTVETLQEHTKLLDNIALQIANSADLTISSTTNAAGETVGALLDLGGNVVAQLASDTVLNIQALKNETSKVLNALDSNQDGIVSSVEIANAQDLQNNLALFSELQNAVKTSAQISASQISNLLSGRASSVDIAKLIDSIDLNGDGFITAIEISSNKDASINQKLFDELKTTFGASFQLSASQITQALASKATAGDIAKLISIVDINGDQVISAAEIQNAKQIAALNQSSVAQAAALANQTQQINTQAAISANLLSNVLGVNSAKVVAAVDLNRNGVVSSLEVSRANLITSNTALFNSLRLAVETSDIKSTSQLASALAGKASALDIDRLIRAVDLNNDQIISAEELQSAKVIAGADASLIKQLNAIFSSTSSQTTSLNAATAASTSALKEQIAKAVAAIDADKDGVISALELQNSNAIVSDKALFQALGDVVGVSGSKTSAQITSALSSKASSANITALINAVDSNADGVVDAQELAAAKVVQSALSAAGLVNLIANTNANTLTKTITQGLEGVVAAVDSNGDGVISSIEFQNSKAISNNINLVGELKNAAGLTTQAVIQGLQGKASAADIASLVAAIDTNSDGIVSAQELAAAQQIAGAGKNALDVIAATFSSATGQAQQIGASFSNSITGQTASLGGLTQEQIAKLQTLNSVQSQALGLTDIVANATDGSETLLQAVLNKLGQQDTGSASIVASLKEGNIQITNFLSQIAAAVKQQSEAAAAEAKRVQDLAKAQADLAVINTQRNTAIAGVKQGIQNIRNLEAQVGASTSKNLYYEAYDPAIFRVNEQGLFEADFDSIFGNFTAFKNAFYAAGGAYDQTYGQAGNLQNLKDQLDAQRQLVISLGGIPQFAKGGVFTNGIVSQPTMFSMAEMGEAGPEAIMPLARGPNGLGVRMIGNSDENNAALIAELRALRAEVAQMRSENRIGMSTIAKGTNKTADLLDDVTQGAERFMTVVEPM